VTSTLGVDLASQPANTALCVIAWAGDHAEVVGLWKGVDSWGNPLRDELIVAAMRGRHRDLPPPAKVAIDAPLGWPVDFVRALNGSIPWPPLGADRRRLERRATDHWVHGTAAKLPLSVTTDRIAFAAMRAAGLLAHCAATGDEVIDVSGVQGLVCETYPDPAIRRLGVWPAAVGARASYKGDARALRASIVGGLADAAPWLRLPAPHREACIESDDCLDALVCALVARAAAKGLTVAPPAELAAEARSEGWIHLPAPGFALYDLV
jgi:predicted nuclease with RNAse H fold